jgi:CBS domain-containing protein/ketosteroid isomerase-like protein
MMERSEELRDFVLLYYQALASKDIGFLERHMSHREGLLVIGADSDAWWAGYASVMQGYGAQVSEGARGIRLAAGDPQAYREGSVGWAADLAKIRLPEGSEIPCRLTMVWHQESGHWKIVQHHLSVGVGCDDRYPHTWRYDMNRSLRTADDILKLKGREIWSVAPDTTVFEALQLMADKGIGAVVVKEDGRLVGVMSERDYARKVILKGKASRDIPVREIMTERVVTVYPDTLCTECMALMTEKHIRHLPVVETGKLVGLISIGDVVKAVISEQQYVIERQRQMWEYNQP